MLFGQSELFSFCLLYIEHMDFGERKSNKSEKILLSFKNLLSHLYWKKSFHLRTFCNKTVIFFENLHFRTFL